jgi:hypothetical protein
MKNKRGSHVGVVISFVIFIMFLVFIYTVLQPKIRVEKEKQTTLDNLKGNFLEKISAKLVSTSILNDNPDYSGGCIEIDENEAGISGFNSVVKNSGGSIINSSSSGGFLKIAEDSGDFFKIYSSKEEFKQFPTEETTCTEVTADFISEKKCVFRTRIYSLMEEYESDYENLKKELEVPEVDEFGFNFEQSNGTIIGTKESGIEENIYSERIYIQYLDKNANIENGIVDVKVW